MKKMNRKGFTLIELLAVLVILVVIMAIAIPSVTSSIERSKQKEYDQLIVSAAELCQDRYANKFTSGNDVSVKKLVELKFLTEEEAKDPFTGDTIAGCVHYNTDSTFKFEKDISKCKRDVIS